MKPLWWVHRVIADTRLSIDARGLLIWLGSRPASWRYSVVETQTALGVGRQKYQGLMAELKALGYVEATHKRDRGGRIKHTALLLKDTAPEGGKSCLRSKPHRKAGFKAFGPEGGKSCLTSKKNHTPETLKPERPLKVVGGRDA